MVTANPATQSFSFRFFRFIGTPGNRTTEIVRDYAVADGMRGIVDSSAREVADSRIVAWATEKGLSLTAKEPFPSQRYAGKVWLEYHLGGITL